MDKTPLFSALMPTRGRPDGIRKTIKSLNEHVADPESMEIILRVDDDDEETKSMLSELDSKIKYHIGSRYLGYDSMGAFVSEISDLSKAPWVFLIDDDAIVNGDAKIDLELGNVPQGNGNVCVCEYYKLNHSIYRGALPVGMFVPTNAWKQFGYEICRAPVDLFWTNLFVKDNKWKLNLLAGLTYEHNWEGLGHHFV